MEISINCVIKFSDDEAQKDISFDEIRHHMKLSKRAFARLLGVSSQAVYNWESGKSTPRREFVDKALKLYGGEDDPAIVAQAA